jgi:hypothetical protein
MNHPRPRGPTWADVHYARKYLAEVIPATAPAMSASECVQLKILIEGHMVDAAHAVTVLDARLAELQARWARERDKGTP